MEGGGGGEETNNPGRGRFRGNNISYLVQFDIVRAHHT
jgi:hypothetical protein